MKKTSKKLKAKRHNNMAKSPTGITLVALVITIIIIIILATVTINMAFGDDGIIKRAEQAADMYANDTAYTDESMANAAAYLDEMLNGVTGGGTDEPEEPFEPQPTPEPPTGGKEMEDMTNGIIEIKWLRGNTNNVTETPNAPVIKTDLPSGTTMEQVVYDEGSNTWVAGTEYSYLPGTGSSNNTASHWANAKVTKDGIDSYFVWIPRYAYRIIYFDSSDSKKAYQEGTITEEEAVAGEKIIGYSDSRGIVDREGKKIESVASTTHTMVSEDYFMVHPAFTAEEENGGWDSQIAGIWIGKYEASLANKVDGTNIVPSSSTDGDILLSENTDKTIVTKPGYNSWRYITIGNSYTNALAYDTNLNSHMLKNSEWGAVAYLTESKYGRNGPEIGFSNEGYITGGGAETGAIETNADQSTTGNVYGIYDLRGGAFERVASYYNGSDVNTTNLKNGESFTSVNGPSTKFATAYTGTSTSTAYKYGDATYETSGWHSDLANFVNSIGPFFLRGGYYRTSASGAGVFCSTNYDGTANYGHSFRVALVL